MSDIPQNPYVQPPPDLIFSPEEPPAKSRGCFFYGCIIAIILAVLGLILIAVLGYVTYSWTGRMIHDYTGTAPIVLPQVNLPEEERKALDERWTVFKQAVDKGEAAELTLTADEINALINEQPDFKGKFYISIKGDKISGKISYPLEGLPLGLGKGRYLNGSATLTVTLRDGELIVHAKEFELNGKSPPPDVMAQFGNENLAKNLANDPKNREMISRFDAIEIKDGKVHLKARSKSDSGESKDKAKDAEEKPKDSDDADMPKAKEKEKEKDKDESETPKPESPKPDEKPGDDAPAEKKAAA